MTPHPLTLKSIELQAWCGCEQRGGRWYLCTYHEAFEDGIEAAVPPELLDALDTLAEYTDTTAVLRDGNEAAIAAVAAWVASMPRASEEG